MIGNLGSTGMCLREWSVEGETAACNRFACRVRACQRSAKGEGGAATASDCGDNGRLRTSSLADQDRLT